MDQPKEDIEKFWKPLYENKKEYNKDEMKCPDWLTTGQTTLIAKKEPTLAEKQRQVLLKIVHE